MTNLRGFLPQIAIDLAVSAINPVHGFSGDYSTWLEAQTKCLGYEDALIVERYNLLFNQRASSGPEKKKCISQRKIRALAAFGLAQQSSNKVLSNVMDFGGAYGGDYWEIGAFLGNVSSWEVVESPEVASSLSLEAMRFQNLEGKLSFDSSFAGRSFDIVYSSGAIQCLPQGLSLLDEFAKAAEFIVLDRVPVFEIPKSRIMVQRTSRLFGGVGSSYPVWFFSKTDFESALNGKWRILLSWDVPEDSPHVAGQRRSYSGYLLQRSFGH